MTIRVGQLVIHTAKETQESSIYQQHSHKAKAVQGKTPLCEPPKQLMHCVTIWGSTAGQGPWPPFYAEFWKGESVLVQWWTCEVWTGRKEETCVFAHRNNTKIKATDILCPCGPQFSACIERKQQGVQLLNNFYIFKTRSKHCSTFSWFWAKRACQAHLNTL